MISWTEEELSLVNNLASNTDLSVKAIFIDLNVEFPDHSHSYDAVQKRVQRIRSKYSSSAPKIEEVETRQFHSSFDIDDIDVPKTDKQDLKEWMDEVYRRTSELNFRVEDRPQGGSSLMINLSDNHFGKHTSTFNMAIARERLLSITNKASKYLDIDSSIEEIEALMVRDRFDGDIYRFNARVK